VLSTEEHRAAALLMVGLPGMRFLHEGQLTGARLRVPVQLLRRKAEPADPEIRKMYEKILTTLKATAVGRGQADLIRPREAWQGNPTGQNIVLVQWQNGKVEFDLVAVNLATHPSQCYAPLILPNSSIQDWSMKDLLGDQQYQRNAADMRKNGLYLDLPAHGAQLWHFQSAGS
jgi:hypothetical protein